jgi:hypothetical protein
LNGLLWYFLFFIFTEYLLQTGSPCINNWEGVICDRFKLHITRLFLNANNLTGVLPSSIGGLQKLGF